MRNTMRAGAFSILLVVGSSCPGAGTENLAINFPDEFNWRLFVKINVPAPDGKNRVWETWADNDTTFPAAPSRTKPPTFPAPTVVATLKVSPVRQLQFLQAELKALGKAETIHPLIAEGGGEEVRRNEAAFDFIVANGLYFKEGIAEAFAKGTRLNFPPEAVEIKAAWGSADSMSEAELKRYYTNTDSTGRRFRLLGIHIISKELPNWTWATFEHADNLGRCDIIGCHDAYGAQVKDVEANATPGKSYGECKHTQQLVDLFNQAGLKEEFWSHYCLKGSQIDFADASGWPTRLGNTQLERVDLFEGTSSCMSCHSRAAYDKGGNPTSSGGFIGAKSPVGYPLPEWFYESPLDPPTPHGPLKALQSDFIWSLVFASPLAQGP